MAHFTYVAQRNDGESYQGVAEAADRFDLYRIVRREGGKIVSVTESDANSLFSMERLNLLVARVNTYQKILFARNLSAMLSAGLPLARALAVIEKQTKNVKLKAVVSSVEGEIRRGEQLWSALEKEGKTFPKLFVAMVHAGEINGEVAKSLEVVADQMERMYDLKKKVRGAMIYPMIIVIAIIGIGYLMMTNVVPTLAETFKEAHAKLPASTQFVVAVSDFLSHYSVFALLGAGAFVAAIVFTLRTKKGARGFDFLILHVPVIGSLVKEINAARTARTLASLLSSRVDVVTALGITTEVVQNSYFQDVLREAGTKVTAGEPLSATFSRHDNLYPAFVSEMAAVGEETGATNDMLQRLAVYYEAEVDRKTKDMSTIVEPFLMLLIGVSVGFFAVAMITPIYQMTQNIN